ncbi:Isopentenyl-diphosphate Delta-isomerase [Roseivivax sp. THAF40]|uniref:isopentenyl-diphosphate Delta-isomerase n=1 Tax=unclassified Roseivivax TaxID=2639302 RepID=UPI0012697D03|nr:MULTISPECIES: isopentenyl-diphosphate Delta-isomerase [unclassified Roseivivax]QFS84761.1 Isopentenyl-diphosphate Delta-isomerase [Roseivivax sp. THAF197b]QFT48588.1 Isopentenyl-diphosphate Delta-isomerase [Roseivivax sp. THAF40]
MTTLIPAWEDGALRAIEKLEVHRRGLRHKAISVFVMRGEEILLQRRALGKYHTPGLWANTCCTHPHWNEDPEVCAIRRLGEELGIRGLALDYRDRIEYRADVGCGLIEHEVVDLFTADAPADLRIAPNPDEVMATEWVPLAALRARIAEAPEDFTPWLRIYVTEHAARIFPERLGTAAE